MQILISGATGLTGRALAQHLSAQGHRVRPLVRGAKTGPFTWDPAEGRIELPADTELDVVIHLSGANIGAGRWTARRKAEIVASRVQSTGVLANALKALARPPRQFICASAIGFYGETGDTWVDESSGPGQGFLADLARDWERATAPAVGAGIPTVLLRSGVVLSAAGGALAKLLPPFRWGLGGTLGSGSQYFSWILLDDWVRVVEFLLAHPQITGPVNAVSPNPVTNLVLTKALGEVLHRPTVLPLPAGMVRLAFGEMGQELLLSSARVRPQRLLSAGFEFSEPTIVGALRHVLRPTQ